MLSTRVMVNPPAARAPRPTLGDKASAVSRPGNKERLCILHLSMDLLLFPLMAGKQRQAASERVCTSGCFRDPGRGCLVWEQLDSAARDPGSPHPPSRWKCSSTCHKEHILSVGCFQLGTGHLNAEQHTHPSLCLASKSAFLWPV